MRRILIAAALILTGTGTSVASYGNDLNTFRAENPITTTHIEHLMGDVVRDEHRAVIVGIRRGESSWYSQVGDVRNPEYSHHGALTQARMASVTKLMVATMVMQDVQAGHFSLDTDITDIVDDLPFDAHDVTVRHLLSHRSGIPEIGEYQTCREPLPRPSATEPDKLLGPAGDAADLRQRYTDDELLANSAYFQWLFPPGTDFCYTNSSYLVLGHLLEKVHNTPVPQLFTNRIARPAGMDSSYLATEPGLDGPHMPGAFTVRGITHNVGDDYQPSYLSSAGNIVTTPADMARFHEALGTGTLLQPALVRQMRSRVTAFGNVDNADTYYGLGTAGYRYECGSTPSFFPRQVSTRRTLWLWGHDGRAPGTLSRSVATVDGSRSFTVAMSGRSIDHERTPGVRQFEDSYTRLLDALTQYLCDA